MNSERKIMVEVTKEELEKLNNGFSIKPKEILVELLKSCNSEEKFFDPMTGKETVIKKGNLLIDNFEIRFTIKEL